MMAKCVAIWMKQNTKRDGAVLMTMLTEPAAPTVAKNLRTERYADQLMFLHNRIWQIASSMNHDVPLHTKDSREYAGKENARPPSTYKPL